MLESDAPDSSDDRNKNISSLSSWWRDFKIINTVFLPVAFGAGFNYLAVTLGTIFTAKEDFQNLNGAALMFSFANCIFLCVTNGFASTLDTLCSQSFSSGEYLLAYEWMCRARSMLLCLFPFTMTLYSFTPDICVSMNLLNPIEVSTARKCVWWYGGAFLMHSQFEVTRRYLSNCGRPLVTMWTCFLTVPLYLAIFFAAKALGMGAQSIAIGFFGIQLYYILYIQSYCSFHLYKFKKMKKNVVQLPENSSSDAQASSSLLLVPLVIENDEFSQPNQIENNTRTFLEALHPETKQHPLDIFKNYNFFTGLTKKRLYLSVGIPAVIMMVSESWATELLIIESAYVIRLGMDGVSKDNLDYLRVHAKAITVLIQTFAVLNQMLANAASAAVSVFVGMSIGIADLKQARRYLWIVISYLYFLAIPICLFMVFGRHYLVNVMWEEPKSNISPDPTSVLPHHGEDFVFPSGRTAKEEAAAVILLVGAVFFPFNYMGIALQGVVRGLGVQKIAMWASLSAFYLFGQATIIVLCFAFYSEGVFGLWIGGTVGVVMECVLLSATVFLADWEDAVAQAKRRRDEAQEKISQEEKEEECESRKPRHSLFEAGENQIAVHI